MDVGLIILLDVVSSPRHENIHTFFILAACQPCLASGDTNIIAMSDWSKPISTIYGHSLRARMIVAYGRGAAYDGQWPETQVHLEFQNVSGAIVLPTQFYFDPSEGFHCVMITLPYDSTIRLRANMYGYGGKPGDGLNLTLYPPQAWWFRAGDTNVYFLSGTFTVTTPTNFVPRDFEVTRSIWSGTIELPKMRITVPKP